MSKKRRHLLLSRLRESAAAQAAKRMGLKYIGFGRYEDRSGRLAAKTVDGKLILIPHDEERPEDVVVMSNTPVKRNPQQHKFSPIPKDDIEQSDGENPKIVVTMEPDKEKGMNVSIASEPEDLLQKALDSGESAEEELNEILKLLNF
jgi:hypothetical protein